MLAAYLLRLVEIFAKVGRGRSILLYCRSLHADKAAGRGRPRGRRQLLRLRGRSETPRGRRRRAPAPDQVSPADPGLTRGYATPMSAAPTRDSLRATLAKHRSVDGEEIVDRDC